MPKEPDVLQNYTVKQSQIGRMIIPQTPRVPLDYYPTMHGAYTKDSMKRRLFTGISQPMLRAVSRRSGLISAIISRRIYQYLRISKKWKFDGDVGFKVRHEQHHDPEFEVPEEKKKLAEALERIICKPWVEPSRQIEPMFSSFASKWIQALTIINRPAIELGLNKKRQPVAFAHIDGANIYPTFQIIKQYMQKSSSGQPDALLHMAPNSIEYKQSLQKYADDNEINVDETVEYLYVVRGRPYKGYRHDELLLLPFAPTDEYEDLGYPPSAVERALVYIVGEIMAWSYNIKFFEVGAMLDTILGFRGNFEDEHIKEFIDIVRQNHTGLAGAHTIPVVNLRQGGDIVATNIKQPRNDMSFRDLMEYTIAGACNIFGMPPEAINFASRGREHRPVINNDRGRDVRENKEEGLIATANHLKATMDEIIKRHDPDLCFEWIGLDNTAEDRRRKKIAEDRPILTIREQRLKSGYKPVPDDMTDEDVDLIDNQAWLQKAQSDRSKEMMEKQQAMMQQQQEQNVDTTENRDRNMPKRDRLLSLEEENESDER